MAHTMLGCALRNKGDGFGWHIINDTGHAPVGITAVITKPTYLEIHHAVGAIRVATSWVSVDETYAAKGLWVGASVGLALTRIFLYTGCPCGSGSSTPVNPATIDEPSGNLWVGLYLETP